LPSAAAILLIIDTGSSVTCRPDWIERLYHTGDPTRSLPHGSVPAKPGDSTDPAIAKKRDETPVRIDSARIAPARINLGRIWNTERLRSRRWCA